MDYVELNMTLPDEATAEIIVAELADYPFDSFVTEGLTLKAYIPQSALADCKERTDALLDGYGIGGRRYVQIESQNWNALWESNFEPVEVDGRAIIRAPFHAPRPEYGHMEIVIMPKMSFGTGHHATTRLMVEALLGHDLHSKHGLDMGCGTGVLAIAAVRHEAEAVDAVDIDDMAVDNCRENIAANGVEGRITPLLGDVRSVASRHYDFILANINRNILLRDMEAYAGMLSDGGLLVMSGFLEQDTEAVSDAAQKSGLEPLKTYSRDGWAAAEFRRKR